MASSDSRAKLAAKLGAATVALLLPMLVQLEGQVNRTYRDPIGVLTSCVGHTGPELRMGQVWTDEQCAQQLADDVLKHSKFLTCITYRPLSDGNKAAFASFEFNVGSEAFCNSTLARKANAGDLAGACAELSRWTRAGGVVWPGLVKRRALERKVCES